MDDPGTIADAPETTSSPRPLLLEHVNLNIPSSRVDLARSFYVDALGCALNPRSTNERQLHVNCGASQFHLLHRVSVRGNEPCVVPQRWRGEIRLWTREDLKVVKGRIEDLRAKEGARGDGDGDDDDEFPRWDPPELVDRGDRVLCSCPWGNRFELTRAPEGYVPPGSHPGGTGGIVALASASHRVRPGAAARLRAFWGQTLGCPIDDPLDDHEGEEKGDCIDNERGGNHRGRCALRFVSGQALIFNEVDNPDDAGEVDAYDWDESSAYHLALYLRDRSAFHRAFHNVASSGGLYINPRFEGGPPEFGSARTWEEASSWGQFRVKDLGFPPGKSDSNLGMNLDLETKHNENESGRGLGLGLGLVLELEVRSPGHPCNPLGRL